jgi:hypothetical protein
MCFPIARQKRRIFPSLQAESTSPPGFCPACHCRMVKVYYLTTIISYTISQRFLCMSNAPVSEILHPTNRLPPSPPSDTDTALPSLKLQQAGKPRPIERYYAEALPAITREVFAEAIGNLITIYSWMWGA